MKTRKNKNFGQPLSAYEKHFFKIFSTNCGFSACNSRSAQNILPGEKPNEMLEMYAKQKNPFTVSKDSSELVWNRAFQYLEMNRLFISGGDLEANDSVIYMPYYNDYHKGTSLKIERKQIADSTLFTVQV